MPLYTPSRGWSACGGPVASISGTSADQTLINFTIPGNTIINVGETVSFSWRGKMIQNVDANQTITLAVQVNGADVIRKQGPTFTNAAAGHLTRVTGEIIRSGVTSLMSFISLDLMSNNSSLSGGEIGEGNLLAPVFASRGFGTVPAGVTVNWSADITFSLIMAMLSASASFSFQGFGWHAEKLG